MFRYLQKLALEMSLSNHISVALLLPRCACRMFLCLNTIAFSNHNHVISLLFIFAGYSRTTELHIFHLGYFQISLSWTFCKFQFFYVFVANYQD